MASNCARSYISEKAWKSYIIAILCSVGHSEAMRNWSATFHNYVMLQLTNAFWLTAVQTGQVHDMCSKPCKNDKILSLPKSTSPHVEKVQWGMDGWWTPVWMHRWVSNSRSRKWIWHLYQSQSGEPLANPTLSWKVFQIRLHAKVLETHQKQSCERVLHFPTIMSWPSYWNSLSHVLKSQCRRWMRSKDVKGKNACVLIKACLEFPLSVQGWVNLE